MPPKLIEALLALCALVLPHHLVVADSFRPPACQWCAGNRGIEYVTDPTMAVYSAASGDVTFVGTVAGVLYVVVRTPNDELVTHGKLKSAQVRQGDQVRAGFRIGQASVRLYIGVRKSGVYLNPAECGVVQNPEKARKPRVRLVPIHSNGP